MNVERVAGKTGFAIILPTMHEYWKSLGIVDELELTRLEAQTVISLVDPETAWFVAYDDQVRGLIAFELTNLYRDGGKVGKIHTIYVPRDSQGTTRPAATLWAAAIRWAKENGIRFVNAHASLSHPRVCTVLSAYGFTPVSTEFTKDLHDVRTNRRGKTGSEILKTCLGEHQRGNHDAKRDRGQVLQEPDAGTVVGSTGTNPQQPVHIQPTVSRFGGE